MKENIMEERDRKKPNLFVSLLPLGILIISIISGMQLIGSSPHIPMLMTAIITALIAIFGLGMSWSELEKGITDTISGSLSAILILMTVGVVIGTWMLSGVVPTMIYYGLELISPNLFLPCVLIVCSIVSISLGSSWTTVATVGIAFVGIGTSMGYELPLVAGAIISGSYFGDKMSPFSDSTNLASATVGVDLYTHIKHMFFTTGVTYVICSLIFGIISLKHGSSELQAGDLTVLQTSIQENFRVSPVLLLVPIVVIVLAALKVPALIGLITGAILASLFAVFYQGASIGTIVDCMHYGYYSETGVEVLDSLLSRGGLDSMMWTVSLILLAMMFAGVMEKSGMIHCITDHLAKLICGRGSLVLVTALTSFAMNFLPGNRCFLLLYRAKCIKKNMKSWVFIRRIYPEW